MILDGREVSKNIKECLKLEISKNNLNPTLTVIQVGDNESSNIYINSKRKACLEIGITFKHLKFEENIKEQELLSEINELNNDDSVDGILIQLPLPKHLDQEKLLNRIIPSKDVDGLTEANLGKLFKGEPGFKPCTALGIITLLKYYHIPLQQHVVIVGRSNLVGKPLSQLFLQENATVTVCHSYTKDLAKYTKEADVLVVATGHKHLINKDMIKKGAVIVDVGITRENGTIYGDVLKDNLEASYYTPVPGGVGPMTVTMLLNNVYESYLKRH